MLRCAGTHRTDPPKQLPRENDQLSVKMTALRLLTPFVCLLALAAMASQADTAGEPGIGPLRITHGGFLSIKTTYLRVDVTDAERVVFWVNGRKHEANPGKTDDCGDLPCRTWWEGFSGFKKFPLAYLDFKIAASNETGTTKVVGYRCKRGPFCSPYTLKCSPLDADRWDRLSTDRIQPIGSPLWYYARGLQKCGSLIGLDRDELYAGLGEPDRATEFWATWDLWSDFGDTRSLFVDLRQDRVVAVDGPW